MVVSRPFSDGLPKRTGRHCYETGSRPISRGSSGKQISVNYEETARNFGMELRMDHQLLQGGFSAEDVAPACPFTTTMEHRRLSAVSLL